MISTSECFEILGLSEGVSFDEVKEAYNQLTHKYHPDRGGNDEKMAKINLAYDFLKKNVNFNSPDYKSKNRSNNKSGNNKNNASNNLNLSVDDALKIFSLNRKNITLNKIEERKNDLLRSSFSSFRTKQINAAYNVLKKEFRNSNKNNNSRNNQRNNSGRTNNTNNTDSNPVLTVDDAFSVFCIKDGSVPFEIIEKRYNLLMRYAFNNNERVRIENAFKILNQYFKNNNFKPETVEDALKIFKLDKDTNFNQIKKRLNVILNKAYNNYCLDEDFYSNINSAFRILKDEYGELTSVEEALEIFGLDKNNVTWVRIHNTYIINKTRFVDADKLDELEKAYIILKREYKNK